MVPDGWCDGTIGDLVELQRGFDLPTASRRDGNVPIISSSGVSGRHDVAKSSAPGVVTGRYGTIGTLFFLEQDYWPLNTTLWVRDFKGNDPKFAYYALQRINFAKYADKTGVPGINRNDIHPIHNPRPPLSEQQKIAEILSTWDKAIETTEKLLANAGAQRRALMQQLLTGKKRLRGFEGEWKQHKIGSLLREVRRAVHWSDEETYKLVSIRRRSGGAFLREELKGSLILTKKMRTTKAGDFLISKMQVVHGAMAMTPPELEGCHISGSYVSLIARDSALISIPFFDWLSRTHEMYRKAFLSSYGVHIEKMTFNLDWFFEEKISVPGTMSEQQAIVEILDDANMYCKSLAKQHDQLNSEKRALMQQLLTGKRRVKP